MYLTSVAKSYGHLRIRHFCRNMTNYLFLSIYVYLYVAFSKVIHSITSELLNNKIKEMKKHYGEREESLSGQGRKDMALFVSLRSSQLVKSFFCSRQNNFFKSFYHIYMYIYITCFVISALSG